MADKEVEARSDARNMGISVQLLDFNRYVALDRVGGDEELLREVLELFLSEYPNLLEDVQRAVQQSNAKSLERAAHTLKGSLSTIGAEIAAQTALSLELMGRTGQLDGACEQLGNLDMALRRLATELHRTP
jgi:HPt (histidine-containing phosphotransfer) domain-containing protein